MKAYFLKITGDVQGVSFRYFTRTEAENLGLCGWAQNEHDGSVTVFVQGEEENITKIIEWTKVGSPMATVNNVSVSEVELDEKITGFEVK
jgi:acylphosphatase